MSLARKIALLVAVSVVLTTALAVLAARTLMLRSFLEAERADVRAAVERVALALSNEAAALAATTGDYGSWDDTYEHVVSPDPEYVTSNFSDESFPRTRIDVVTILDLQGRTVFEKAVSRTTGKPSLFPGSLRAHVQPGSKLLTAASPKAAPAGLLTLAEGTFLVAARPILKSNDSGPARGSIVMARRLDDAELARLRTLTRAELAWSPAQPTTGADGRTCHAKPLGELPRVEPVGDELAVGKAILCDIAGSVAGELAVSVPRTTYLEGLNTARYLTAGLVWLGLALGTGFVLFLRWTVLRRLARLARALGHIGAAGEPGARLPVEGSDELAQLAATVNGMLGDLEEAQAARQESLRASETRYRQLVELSPDAHLIHRDHRILFANRAARRLLGDTADRPLEGRDITAVVAPTVLEQLSADVLVESGCERLDGTRVEAELTSAPFPGEEEGAQQIIIRDISRRRALEAQLLLADRMAMVGTLAAGVAHEINNPLTFVSGNLDVIADAVAGLTSKGTPTEAGDLGLALADAREGTARIAAIVRDMRTFSRGDDEPARPIDVRDVLETSVRMIRKEIIHRSELALELHDVAPVTSRASQLGQVLVNLLVNAMQALPDRDAALNRIALRLQQRGTRVLIEVEDNGAGIAPEHLKRIFDPFFTTKPARMGTGLGLSICHNLVTAMGGTIAVRSTVGEGSTFVVELPAAGPAPEQAAAEGSAAPLPSPRARLLVVDDSPEVRRTVSRMLRARCDVEAVDSAKAALALLDRGERFDAVLCDVMMPDMGGADFHAALCQRSAELADRTGFMTGGPFTEKERAFVEGMQSRVIAKPLELRELVSFVQRLRGARRSPSKPPADGGASLGNALRS